QLGQELELLKKRQSALEMRERKLRKLSGANSGSNIRRTLEEYCQGVADRIKTFNETERQRFLRLLVDNIVFEGNQVRIRAVIPINDTARASPFEARKVNQIGQVAEDIGRTSSNSRVLNPTFAQSRIEDTAI